MNTDPKKPNITAENNGPTQRDENQMELDRQESINQVEKINQSFRESPEVSKNYSQASTSKILTTEEEERKKAVLSQMISVEIQKSIEPINQQLSQIPQLIQNTILQLSNQLAEQKTAQAVPENMGKAMAMNPEALAPMMTGIAQLIQAWKGNNGGTPQPDQFGDMFKQLGINIMQAGVDGIYKNVYDGYQPKPRPNTMNIPPPPNQDPQNQSTGFR